MIRNIKSLSPGAASHRLFQFAWLSIPLVSLLTAQPDDVWQQLRGPAFWGLAALIVCNMAALAIPLVFIESRRSRRLFFIPAILLSILVLGYTLHNGAPPGPAVFVAMNHTTRSELIEVLPGLASAYAIELIVAAFLIAWIWLLPHRFEKTSRMTRLFVINLAIWITNLLIFAWMFAPQHFSRWVPPNAENAVFPGSLIASAYSATKTDVHEHLSAGQRAFRFNAIADDRRQALRIVLVIGESSTGSHWQLSGYGRQTNPQLSSISKGQLVYFPDVLSGATATRGAVPMILTRATPMDFSPATRERSIVSAFSETGYVTGWLSLQDRFPYSEEASHEIYINPDWAAGERYDEDLLPLINTQIDKHKRLFLVAHSIGSHVQYPLRVPRESRHFSNRSNADLLDFYDDTIRYTDRFLSRIIDRLAVQDDIPSLLIYISDHGQDLNKVRTGELSQGAAKFPTENVHVPLLVWLSPAYLAKWPEVSAQLEKTRECPHSQIEVFHTLLRLGHIRLDGNAPSLFDEDCARTRPVMAGSRVKYFP